MSTTVIKSIDVEVRTIENHPKLDWAKIAHFNGVDSQHTKEMAIQWLNRTFKLNQELQIRLVDNEGLIIGSLNREW